VKKTIIYITSIIIILAFISSCRNEVEHIVPNDNEDSIALRLVLNSIKENFHLAKTKSLYDSICFDFEYPIELILNNETSVKIENFEGLLSIIINETPELHVSSISMPFNVVMNNKVESINSEVDFFDLLYNCGMIMPVQSDFFSGCFTFKYPINAITIDNYVHTIESQSDFETFLQKYFDIWYFEFEYPLEVTLNEGSSFIINNEYDLFDVLNDCFNCGCSDNYDPVCVTVDGDIYEFYNSCDAECAGYYNYTSCTDKIANLNVIPGDCDANTKTYSLSINFDYYNVSSEFFFVKDAAGNILREHFLFTDLPITIQDYSGAGYVSVLVPDNAYPQNNMNEIGISFEAPSCE